MSFSGKKKLKSFYKTLTIELNTLFIQSTGVSNFRTIRPFFTSLGCPNNLGKNKCQGPKKKYFQKMKKRHPPGFHPI